VTGDAEALTRRFYAVLQGCERIEDAVPRLEPLLHPDAEYVNPPDALEPGTRRGLDGWRAVLDSTITGLGQSARFDLQEVVERGDRVFARVALRTGGGASGVEVEGPTIGVVFTVEDGRIRRFEWHWRPEDARAAFARGA
jgi:ketosteroid isomerase-like protein